jgi:hypothetical protein
MGCLNGILGDRSLQAEVQRPKPPDLRILVDAEPEARAEPEPLSLEDGERKRSSRPLEQDDSTVNVGIPDLAAER